MRFLTRLWDFGLGFGTEWEFQLWTGFYEVMISTVMVITKIPILPLSDRYINFGLRLIA